MKLQSQTHVMSHQHLQTERAAENRDYLRKVAAECSFRTINFRCLASVSVLAFYQGINLCEAVLRISVAPFN